MFKLLIKHLAGLRADIAKARHFDKLAGQIAQTTYELMRVSGCTRDELQAHVNHSGIGAERLLKFYRTYGLWPCDFGLCGSGKLPIDNVSLEGMMKRNWWGPLNFFVWGCSTGFWLSIMLNTKSPIVGLVFIAHLAVFLAFYEHCPSYKQIGP